MSYDCTWWTAVLQCQGCCITVFFWSCGSWISCSASHWKQKPAPCLLSDSINDSGCSDKYQTKTFCFYSLFSLISSFGWKSHTKSWQELGNVNRVKLDQILSQAASLNIIRERDPLRLNIGWHGWHRVRFTSLFPLIILSMLIITMFGARYKMSSQSIASIFSRVLRPGWGPLAVWWWTLWAISVMSRRVGINNKYHHTSQYLEPGASRLMWSGAIQWNHDF